MRYVERFSSVGNLPLPRTLPFHVVDVFAIGPFTGNRRSSWTAAHDAECVKPSDRL
jgi:hypothetical protein